MLDGDQAEELGRHPRTARDCQGDLLPPRETSQRRCLQADHPEIRNSLHVPKRANGPQRSSRHQAEPSKLRSMEVPDSSHLRSSQRPASRHFERYPYRGHHAGFSREATGPACSFLEPHDLHQPVLNQTHWRSHCCDGSNCLDSRKTKPADNALSRSTICLFGKSPSCPPAFNITVSVDESGPRRFQNSSLSKVAYITYLPLPPATVMCASSSI